MHSTRTPYDEVTRSPKDSRIEAFTTPEMPTPAQQTPAIDENRTRASDSPASSVRVSLGRLGRSAQPRQGEQPADPDRREDDVDHQAHDRQVVVARGRRVPGEGRRQEREAGEHRRQEGPARGDRRARHRGGDERHEQLGQEDPALRHLGDEAAQHGRVERLARWHAEDVGDGEHQLDGHGDRPRDGGPHRQPGAREPGSGQHVGRRGQQQAGREQETEGGSARAGPPAAARQAVPSR